MASHEKRNASKLFASEGPPLRPGRPRNLPVRRVVLLVSHLSVLGRVRHSLVARLLRRQRWQPDMLLKFRIYSHRERDLGDSTKTSCVSELVIVSHMNLSGGGFRLSVVSCGRSDMMSMSPSFPILSMVCREPASS